MLQELGQPFSESANPTHVTASAIVIGERGVVLHKHKRLGIWLQPGGHIEEEEDPPTAALREAQEETGLPVAHPINGPRFIHIDVHPGPRGHTHIDLRYLLQAPDTQPGPLATDESQEVAWFFWESAVKIADDSLRGALQAAAAEIPTSWKI